MVELKQSGKKAEENFSAALQRLLPAAFKESHLQIVGGLIARWLKLNRFEAEGAIVDASVANILEAINALDESGLLRDCWDRPPVKKPEKKRPDYLQSREGDPVNHARETRVSEIDIQMAQEKKRREALGDRENAETMAEAVSLIQRHTSSSHSKTAKERDVLKREFDRLVAAKTHPKKLLEAIQAKQESFYSSSIR